MPVEVRDAGDLKHATGHLEGISLVEAGDVREHFGYDAVVTRRQCACRSLMIAFDEAEERKRILTKGVPRLSPKEEKDAFGRRSVGKRHRELRTLKGEGAPVRNAGTGPHGRDLLLREPAGKD